MRGFEVGMPSARSSNGGPADGDLPDGIMAYPYALWKELGTGTSGQGNPHRRVPSIRAPKSNNRIEQLRGTEKERTKVMRAFDTDDTERR